MASPEEVIEPIIESSAAQSVDRRRFSRDLRNLSPDVIDGLMSTSGKEAYAYTMYMYTHTHTFPCQFIMYTR